MMRSLRTMWYAVIIAGLVGGLLGIIAGYPLERVMFAAGLCAGLMLLLLLTLRMRP